jgi:hypothetical protein
VRMGVTVSALCLAVVGAVLLFAPVEAGNLLMPGLSRPVLVQLIGAAPVGYGITNWTARGALLGGIYGRAPVAGNQAHFMIGALLLMSQGNAPGASHPAYWVLTILYLIGAAFFSYCAARRTHDGPPIPAGTGFEY